MIDKMDSTPEIKTIMFRCREPNDQRRFYREVLGMVDHGDEGMGYGCKEARLFFTKSNGSYRLTSNDLYWKIALAVPNIELACQQLLARGVKVGTPRQFQDIGYLAHFKDPEGFTIELIEHWFQGQRQPEAIEPDTFGGGAHLNLLTLRTTNIDNIIRQCCNWGMKQLSIQPVESHGFTLFFFAFTQESPPSMDLQALENREWLYQRRYTILEVQHVHSGTIIKRPTAKQAGYAGAVFTGLAENDHSEELLINTVA